MSMPLRWITMSQLGAALVGGVLLADLVAHATKVLGNLVTLVGVLGANPHCNAMKPVHRSKFVMQFV